MTTAIETATKVYTAPFEIKDDATGAVQAAFSVFNTIDSDGDVVKPGAFEDGQEVPMVWSHQWDKPVGRGVVKVGRKQAIFAGRDGSLPHRQEHGQPPGVVVRLPCHGGRGRR